MRMKFADCNLKSDDELISLKERKGRTTLPHPRESDMIHVRIWLVNSALDSVECRMDQMTPRGIEWIHVW